MLLRKSLHKLLEVFLLCLFSKKKGLPIAALIWQENQVLRRSLEQHNIQITFDLHEKWFIHMLFKASPASRKFFTLVTPETILYQWKRAVSDYWNNSDKRKIRKKGRPPITKKIKKIICDMKIWNYLWGCFRIHAELKKVNVDVSRETIRKVIAEGRKSGEIKPNLSWKKFLTSQWQSLFACDFFTVDCFGFTRLYVFFIIELKSRTIVQYSVTKTPNILFLRNQLSYFSEMYPASHLIHDNARELYWFPYEEYGIKGVATTPYSPNMNAYAERFVRSVRQECLDWFIVFSETQLRTILKEYMAYYNQYRPHQGIGKIPDAKNEKVGLGEIKKKAVLFGLHYHYYREAV